MATAAPAASAEDLATIMEEFCQENIGLRQQLVEQCDKQPHDQRTPLITACACGAVECVRLLRDAGANQARTCRDMNARQWAEHNGHADCAKLLRPGAHPHSPLMAHAYSRRHH